MYAQLDAMHIVGAAREVRRAAIVGILDGRKGKGRENYPFEVR